MFFGLAQYMQYVLGYSPLGTAIRTLPFAVAMLTISPLGPQLAQRFGVHAVIGSGLSVTALGLTALITVDGTSGYLQVLIGLYIASAGMALALPAATEAIIGSLPQDKAGVASAVNDTTREVGAAVGIALLGSLLSLGYRGGVGDAFSTLGPEGAEAARDSVGAALHLASLTPEDVGGNLANRARDAFASGFSLSMGVGTVLILFVAVVVWRRFPRDRLSQPT